MSSCEKIVLIYLQKEHLLVLALFTVCTLKRTFWPNIFTTENKKISRRLDLSCLPRDRFVTESKKLARSFFCVAFFLIKEAKGSNIEEEEEKNLKKNLIRRLMYEESQREQQED